MHFDLHFTAVEILWTLTFAAILVLLVVLLGRDRMRRFPMFSASIMLIGLTMLGHKLLGNKLPPLRSAEFFLTLGDLSVLISILVAVELARRAFTGGKLLAWAAGAVVLLAGASAVIIWWGPWPPASVVLEHSTLGHLRMMQLVSQKGDLFNEALIVELFVVVVILGRRFKTGWRSHTQQILAGLATASAMTLVVRIIWQMIGRSAPHSQAAYDQLVNTQEKLLNANNTVALLAMVWWIICLWVDEPAPPGVNSGIEVPSTTTAETLDEIIAGPSDGSVEPGAAQQGG
jgi:hypothetical protein